MVPVVIDFQTHPDRYRHWRLRFEDRVARLDMDVDPDGGLGSDYELKLNSYDLSVDIELADAVQRLRFEHPEVGAVVIGSLKERVFCAGANIGMLASAPHPLKVNFCKFTNETRSSIEDATKYSGQRYISAINGTAAGGGYELALATDYIMLIDDGSASVALPEVPLLAVLPGTGGLTRLVDKRFVRRDRADVFCTVEEGIKGERALDWNLVDELVSGSAFEEEVVERATEMAAASDRPNDVDGVELTELERRFGDDRIEYSDVTVEIDRAAKVATITVNGPDEPVPTDAAAAASLGADFWPLRLARELDDAILHLRNNELGVGTFLLHSRGSLEAVVEYDRFLGAHSEDWFVREVLLMWKRVLKRVDLTSRTVITLVEPNSCFGGFLAELVLASDRGYMFEGTLEGEEATATLFLTESNTGPLPMSNDLTRLETRFWGDGAGLERALKAVGATLTADQAYEAALVTEIFDEIDWDDELRMIIEERSSFSPDALTGMEANLRFAGPETLETKIFGRLTAWQNWVFQRPNASGETGALRRYGTGLRPDYDTRRV
ncbi:MAG: 2,3-epoxybenzoyl-CoA dihydrolase [Acidimicrobiia bacterium]